MVEPIHQQKDAITKRKVCLVWKKFTQGRQRRKRKGQKEDGSLGYTVEDVESVVGQMIGQGTKMLKRGDINV